MADLRADLEAYLQQRGAAEHVSAAALSVSLPDQATTVDVSAGTTGSGGSVPVQPDAPWQIGSNTKAFTSVLLLLLQLEAERRLSIDDPVSRWLPQYPQWHDVPIRRLLDMTSGIPTYDDQPAFLTDQAADPLREFTQEELVGYVVGAPATSGYSYSNTNYVLAEMIIERVTGTGYVNQLSARLLGPLGLRDTYYRSHLYPPGTLGRLPAGYYTRTDEPELSPLVGRDVSRDSLSWARGAGGILSTTADMTRWERALYEGWLLPPQQQAELMSLVSTATGEPIEATSPDDPRGFGLGVAQVTDALGTFWFYEGQTLGFRFLHAWFPESGLIVAMGLNSRADEDRIGVLATTVYETLVAHGLAEPVPAGTGA
ncbi:serine hydrolase domain-containing protein [Geodermatophilus chilensis]|uniref:serine hydrolase domain-containing protein n=1 Tax=Geodermatophilus chilensis TaxID=2035835 RepID=UPI001E33040E|nr:serine hydrolase domain-containing protein [Geodermatophilus chilensis]